MAESKKILKDIADYMGYTDYLGILSDDDPFHGMLEMHVNSELSKLVQLGVIPAYMFTEDVTTDTSWADVLPDEHRLSMAKTYVKIGVKLAFDPPTSSALLDSLRREKDECEWRAKVAMETP